MVSIGRIHGWSRFSVPASRPSIVASFYWLRYALMIALLASSCVFIGVASGLAEPATHADNVVQTQSEPDTVHAVLSYALSWKGAQRDPLIAIAPGLEVKSSNINGILINGNTYYYSLAPHRSFDPLSRGVLGPDQIHVVGVIGDVPNRVTIYVSKS